MIMRTLTRLGVSAGAAILGAGLVWRYAVRQWFLPCPSWLAWTLENPLTEAIAGSAMLLERADVRPGMRVLDAGCGPGRLTFPAAARVGAAGEVVALDIQPQMLDTIERRVRATGVPNVRPHRAALGQGSLEPNQFDRVLLVTVLGEIPDRRAAMAELASTLRPGGLLSVTEVLPDPHYQSRRTVEGWALEAGLHRVAYFGSVLAFTANFAKPGPAGRIPG
jgi:ubiquinone/menaquinone biosynthesis C-methylase UbiE